MRSLPARGIAGGMKSDVVNFGIELGDSVPPATCAKTRAQMPSLFVTKAPAPAAAPAHRNLRLVVIGDSFFRMSNAGGRCDGSRSYGDRSPILVASSSSRHTTDARLIRFAAFPTRFAAQCSRLPHQCACNE